MEELRSTEILDKEIQSDARKKAERILERAKTLFTAVASRLANAEQELQAKTDEACAEFAKDKDAALPLEKARFFVSYVQETMEKCLNAYTKNLSEDGRLSLLFGAFQKYTDALHGKKVFVSIYGFNMDAVKNRFDDVLQVLRYEQTEFNKRIAEDDCRLEKKEGIIIESEDKTVRIRLTIPEFTQNVLNTYRTELYSALFGGRLTDK